MSLTLRLCLLLAIGSVLAVSVSGEENLSSGVSFNVWDAFRPQSRSKREPQPVLGFVGTIVGWILLRKANLLTIVYDAIDTPLRWVYNVIAAWANWLENDTRGNPIYPPIGGANNPLGNLFSRITG